MSGAYLALAIVVALTGFQRLWFVDEEIYFGHGVRIVSNQRIGWQVDCWNPPLSFLIHGSALLFHPWTPDLRGTVLQDPELPPGETTVPGKKNPVIYDSSAWQIRSSVEAAGHRFDRYAFWARLPLAIVGLAWLFVLWRTLVLLRIDPLPGTILLALSHVFVIEQVRIQADALVAGCVLLAAWRALEFARKPTFGNGALLGVTFGLGLGSKLSILPLLPAILLALVAWRQHFAPVAPPRIKGWIAELRGGVPALLLAAPVAFVVLWSVYGFQTGTLVDRYEAQRPLATRSPGFVVAHPAISQAILPMPSFLIALAVNRDVAGAGTHIKIDEAANVPWWRKVQHYSGRLFAHVGHALLPLALLVAWCAASTRRTRWLLVGLAILVAAYMAGMWLQNLEMYSRRAIVLTNLAALVAGLAWRHDASALERRVRGWFLALHVAFSALQYILFVALRDATYGMPIDQITGFR